MFRFVFGFIVLLYVEKVCTLIFELPFAGGVRHLFGGNLIWIIGVSLWFSNVVGNKS